MKETFMLAAGFVCLLGALPIRGAVANGDFETPGPLAHVHFARWVESIHFLTSVSTGDSHGGVAASALSLAGSISQIIPEGDLVTGNTYQLTFWAKRDDARNPAFDLVVDLPDVGANPDGTGKFALTSEYKLYSLCFTAEDKNNTLRFTFVGLDTAKIDDVSITAGCAPTPEPTPVIPEPTTIIAGALLLVPVGVSALRLRRKQA